MNQAPVNDENVKTILVADDSAYIRQMIRFALPLERFRVLEAEDGQQALDYFDFASIDLLVTDLKMPKLDGIALIRQVRERPGMDCLPIIMLTAVENETSREQARRVGVSAYIAKPFVPEQISGLIQSLFF